MMGTQAEAARLFYDFCLDDHVPKDHQLRGIDRHLDLEGLRAALKPFYSSTGRPSVDPELMIRMLLVGYCLGIRSERRLCEEVHLNLAYRWFCRLGLDGKVPDHSTFSKNRHGRFRESDILRRLFESIVERCMVEGLVGADGFAVDASLIAADANKQRSVSSSDWNPAQIGDGACRAAREYLATLDDAAFGAASSVTPKFIARSDPAAQWTGAHKGHAFFAYATNYLIDTDHGVIVDVEATRAIRLAEVGAARTMLERTEERFGLKPDYLVADTAYGSADNLAWLVKQKRITPLFACRTDIAVSLGFESEVRTRERVLFAHLKRILRLGRLRLRGPCGAKDEFLLAATAQNLRRLARLRPAGFEMAA